MKTTTNRVVAASAMVEAERVDQKRVELLGRFGPFFARVEPFTQAGKYIRGLMSDRQRKNCWSLAEYAGDRTPDRMQRLLDRAVWDTFAVMAAVRDFVVEHLTDGLCVLVIDESGVIKTGTATCGVKRQYVGCVGKVANAVNLVNATYSTALGHALIGSQLYIPAEHLADDARRTDMGIDQGHEFKTKPQIGADLLTDAVNAGAPIGWCTADAVYGRDRDLREVCEQHQIGYSVGVPRSFRITMSSGDVMRADATVALVPDRSWQVASCGTGSKGDRRYAWAWLATRSDRHFLLIRRSLHKPTELAFFYCHVPTHVPATLGVLVAVTGRRWTVEEDHEFSKDQFGFDEFQVRLYTPIMRHITLVMAALAICAVVTADARGTTPPTPTHPNQPPPADLPLIALSVVEIKRLFNLLTRTWQPIEHYLHWSWWRRRHQARARWYHHRTRLT